ncbi:hypothetical protein ABZY68_25400 [Streptomyces sp. NPDC006482]|uniref:hypothetical protein n=1 Tax=Streptomyces sp. NPDC006482 TaxID=3154306 RepID=UPI0033A754C6
MSQFVSRSLIPNARVEVLDLPALRSPDFHEQTIVTGPRLALAGRITPVCRDCSNFEHVVTLAGAVTCTNPVHAKDKPKLPMRPTPHERDGRMDKPQPVRPHSLLVG